VVVVTHGGPIRVLLGAWLGLDMAGMLRLDLDTGHGTLLQQFADGGVRVVGINLPPSAWSGRLHSLQCASTQTKKASP